MSGLRAGTFETGVASAQDYGKNLFEQTYGRGYRGRSPGFTEDYEDSQKDIVANSFRFRAAQEEARAHQYAAAADYLKTIDAQRLENAGNNQQEQIRGQWENAKEGIRGQWELGKQGLADQNAMQRTIVDNEYDNVRKDWEIKDNQYRERLKEQGLMKRSILDNVMDRVIKGMEIEGSLRNTIISKQMEHQTAMAREEIISRDNQMRMAKELYDNPETQFAWVEFQKAMKNGDLQKAAQIYTVGKLFNPTVRQEDAQDKRAKDRRDFEYRAFQDQLGQANKDREFKLALQSEGRQAITQAAANYSAYLGHMEKLDAAWNEKINDPMLKPEEKQALINDQKYIGPAIQAMQGMSRAQSPEEMEAWRQELTKYVNAASPVGRNYIQQRAKIGALAANSEAELYGQYGLHVPQNPDLLDDAQPEESKIGKVVKGVGGFLWDSISMLPRAVLDPAANEYYNTEPQRVDITAQQVLRSKFRGQGFRGKLLDEKVNNTFNSMDNDQKIKFIRDNVSLLEKIQAVTDAKAQSNPAANFDTETNRDAALTAVSLGIGALLGAGGKWAASSLARGAVAKGVTTPNGQALLSRLTSYFSKREAEVLSQSGLAPIEGGTPWQQITTPGLVSRGPAPGVVNPGTPFPNVAAGIADTSPRVFSPPPPDAAPFPAQMGAYRAPFPTAAQGIADTSPRAFGPPMQNPIFETGTSSYSNAPVFQGSSGGTTMLPGPGSQANFTPSLRAPVAQPQLTRVTAQKISVGKPVSVKEARAVLGELKVNPQAAFEVPEVQQAVQAGMPPEEAVAQWTTKLLQNTKGPKMRTTLPPVERGPKGPMFDRASYLKQQRPAGPEGTFFKDPKTLFASNSRQMGSYTSVNAFDTFKPDQQTYDTISGVARTIYKYKKSNPDALLTDIYQNTNLKDYFSRDEFARMLVEIDRYAGAELLKGIRLKPGATTWKTEAGRAKLFVDKQSGRDYLDVEFK